jgi:hypothetical protein
VDTRITGPSTGVVAVCVPVSSEFVQAEKAMRRMLMKKINPV